MKGKRTCKERILAFMLTFAMVVGMVMEPVQLQAAAVEGEPVQEEIVTEPSVPEEEQTVEENSGISLFSAEGSETDVTETGTGDGTGTGEGGDGTSETTEPGEEPTEPGGDEGEPGDTQEESVSITLDSLSLAEGETYRLEVVAFPEGTAVTWSSDNEWIATVNNGLVTAVAPGNTVITASTDNGAKDTINIEVTAKQYTVTGTVKTSEGIGVKNANVTLSDSAGKLYEAETEDNGRYSITCPEGTYTVTATRDGMHMQGNTVIVTVGDDQSNTADVILELDDINIPNGNQTIKVDETFDLSIEKDYSIEEESIQWSTDRSDIVGINDLGNGSVKITGLQAGLATVTATLNTMYGEKTASCQVTVEMRGTTTTLAVQPTGEDGKIESVRLIASIYKNDINEPVTEGNAKFWVYKYDRNVKDYQEIDFVDNVKVENGEAVFTFTSQKKYGLSGRYKFAVQYGGVENKYSISEAEEAGQDFEDNIPITFEGIDISKPIEITYGDMEKTAYEIPIDKEAFIEEAGDIEDPEIVKYTYAPKDDLSAEVLEVNDNGIVKFKKASKTPVIVKITREIVDTTPDDPSDDYYHPATSIDFEIKVLPKTIKIDTKFKGLTYSKIYDKELEVNSENSNGDKISDVSMIPFENGSIVNDDDVKISSITGTLSPNVINVKTNDVGEVIPYSIEDASITLSDVKLTGDNADNYIIDLGVPGKSDTVLAAEVTINKRPIKLKVSDGSREYGHWNEITYVETPVQEIENYEKPDIEGILDGDEVTFPIPTEIEIPKTEAPDYSNGDSDSGKNYQDKLTVYQYTKTGAQNGDPGNNYVFDFTNVKKGTLTVTKEKIEDYMDYLNFDEASGNAYISPKTGVIWASAQNESFQIYPQTIGQGAYYDQVVLAGVGQNLSEEGTGIDLSQEEFGDGDKKTVEIYLRNSSNNSTSEKFEVELSIDVLDAVVTNNSISSEIHGIPEVVDMITFGKFHNALSTRQETAEVSDGSGSGVYSWSYNVMTGDDDDKFTGEAIESYIDPTKDTCTWTLISEKDADSDNANLNGIIPLPDQEDNYVVLLKLQDNVGHCKVYASNGVIVDYTAPKAYISLDEGQTVSSTGVYGDDVALNIHVQDIVQDVTDSASAIKKVELRVENNGKETDKVTLLDIQSSPEMNMEGTGKTSWTLGELDEYRSKDLKYTVNAEENNSNNVAVYVTVWDNADNAYDTEAYPLQIDITAPVIEAKYTSEAQVQNEKYYNRPMQAEITYTERNFSYDKNYLWFDVQVEGKNIGTYSVSELQNELGIVTQWKETQQDDTDSKQWTDARKHTLLLTFNRDDKYVFTPHIKDLAEATENPVYDGVTQDFVIDQKAPVMEVGYEVIDNGAFAVPMQEENRAYSNKAVRTIVTINEHNFALEGKDIQADVEVQTTKVGEGETVPDYNAQQKVNDGNVWAQQNVDTYKSVYTFSADANYTHSITYTDLAGNSVTYGPGYFTVDKTNPTGSVSINGFGFWETLLHNITFGLFNPSSVDVEVAAADHTSPLNPIQYFRTPNAMTRDQLEAYDWSNANAASWENPGYAAFTVNPDEQFVVYTRVTDYAGNYEYFSSDGMIVDSTKPAPVVTITNLSQSQNGIFNEDVTLQIDVEDPYAGDTYSGLERVWYTVSASGNVNTSETIELLNNSSSRVQSNQTFSQVITVPANVYNSNDVKVQAFAVDFSGNQGESEVTEMKIDVTNPTISVSWDLNNPLNGSYYKDTRTATVTVTDRNFDPNNVRFSITNTDGTEANIGGWSSSSDIGVSDNATSTCQVAFPADGDYTFTLGCTDLAGNSTEYGQTDEFTIDKTVPEISVSYNNNSARNGNYYNEARTATVTVREHNFNAADVKAAITASLEGRGISAPSISGFSGSGDVHTATVTYGTDGDYTFDVEYTDMAGNAAADYTPDDFTVDLTEPEIEITDVADKSANNDVVSPSVKATDVNYDSRNVTITITGAKNGKVNIGNVVSAIQNGQTVKFNDFAREDRMDDLYTLTAKAIDMAGNEKEESIIFSVNRYGSVYVLDTDTAEWLDVFTPDENGEDETYEYTYINQEREIGVTEYNVDTIEQTQITVNRDGNIENLKEKTDYEVTSSGTEAQWKANHYVLKADNFATEGNYSVIFSTQDKAGNTMNNTSVKKNENLPIDFSVDKTAPTVVISGVEDGGSYRSAEQTMTVDAKDNLALHEVVVSVDGTDTIYETDILAESNGVIDMPIASANNFQQIEVTASDKAGNIQKMISNGDEQKESLSVLVTPNIMVQYYMNKPLFYGSIIGIVAVAGLIIFLVVWKRRKNEGKR